MADRREAVIARLVVIAAAIPGINRAVRNQEDVSGRMGPLIAIWEGDEQSLTDNRGPAGRMVEMTPETRILCDAKAADVGTQLNGFRAALIKAVLNDAELLALVSNSTGGIYYRGCTAETQNGERIEGGLSVNFAFKYPLVIDEL